MLYITLSECHFKKIMLSIPFDSARVCPKPSSTGVFSSPLAEKVNTSRVKKNHPLFRYVIEHFKARGMFWVKIIT